MKKKKEESYRLTVKGFLAVETKMFTKFDSVWNNLRKFVKKEAELNGCNTGIPCIIFLENGKAECITVEIGDEK